MADSFYQWIPAIAGAVLGLGLFAFMAISTRRLDARIRARREAASKAAEQG